MKVIPAQACVTTDGWMLICIYFHLPEEGVKYSETGREKEEIIFDWKLCM